MLCFGPMLHWCVWYNFSYVRKKALLQLRVWQCLWIVLWNNLQCVWVWLLYCCWMLWMCLVWVLLYPKLTYSTHIHNITVQAHKPPPMIKALITSGWGKQKETLMATYKAVMGPALEYASSIWSPLALTNCMSCRMEHWEVPQDAHKTQTYNICMTKHLCYRPNVRRSWLVDH